MGGDRAGGSAPARLDPSTRVHIVSGKGGTGKTTVAAALAIALADTGKSVLLCEVEGRQGIARLFDLDPLPYAERRITTSATSGQLYGLHIDAEAAFLEYLQLYYHLGPAGRALDRFGVIDFATTIAPGVRDVLLTGKVYEAAKRDRRGGGRSYDAVVLDAPPTGRITQFLGVNNELAGLAKVGPIKSQADSVTRLLTSVQTAVHFVTLLEEMPVQETIDATAELAAAGLRLGAVIVNQVRTPVLTDATRSAAWSGALDRGELAADLTHAHVIPTPELIDALAGLGREHAERRLLEDEESARLTAEGLPTVALPRLSGGIDEGALRDLALQLTAQLLSPSAPVPPGRSRR
ncbi:MAG: ArsA-related P-loop ATPase [Nocardioides sp.]